MNSAYKIMQDGLTTLRRNARLDEQAVHIFTDGASSRPPSGPGGWASVLLMNTRLKIIAGGGPRETNNTMELSGILFGLQEMRRYDLPTYVYSDSKYSLKCVTQWHFGWRRKGWVTASGTPVKNRPLIEGICEEMAKFACLRMVWVPGHAGIHWNEQADRYAVEAKKTYSISPGRHTVCLTEDSVLNP